MMRPEIVLCAVDLTATAAREVELASEVCAAFGARLVLHHNVSAVAPGLTRAWEWEAVYREAHPTRSMVDHRLRDLMKGLPGTFPAEAAVTTGALVPIVLDLATRLPADLIVLGSHGWSTEEHTSVAERVLARSPCPVLTVHDPTAPPRAIAMRALPGHAPPEVVVPIDATDAAAAVAAYAFEVARALGPRLHLLHVEPTLSSAAHAATRRRLEAMIPPDLADRVECHVEAGEPVERIMDFLCERLPAYAIMGEHARGLFRRVFTRDTARELLHRAPCPVWFVPSR